MTRLFPVLVAVLETGAALIFAWSGNVRMTVLWAGYAVAAWALAGLE